LLKFIFLSYLKDIFAITQKIKSWYYYLPSIYFNIYFSIV